MDKREIPAGMLPDRNGEKKRDNEWVNRNRKERRNGKNGLWGKIPVIGNWIRIYREYAKVTNLTSISRRYFVIGSFDGALTILGVILGSLHSLSRELVITAGVAGGVALAVSSIVGAYEAERVENKLEHRELENAMLTKVGGTHEKAVRFTTIVSSLVHGASPLIAAMIPVIPFLFMEVHMAVVVSIALTLSFLFIMGAYMGSLIKENIIYSGLRFIMAGLLTAVITYLIGGGHSF